MADIDMIPRSYREAARTRRTLATYGTALALLVAVGCGASLLLRWRLAVETPRLERMRAESTLAGTLRSRLAVAQQSKDALAGDVDTLASLSGAGEAAQLAQVLDATLNDKVWIEQLRFSHTRELLRDPLPSPLPPGTVQAHPAQGPAQAWQLGTHVELSGRALDQRAMTDFLAALAAHPALSGVRFLNSSEAPAEEGGAVAFGAAASLVRPIMKPKEAP
jgi:Tfp pilus assembly protein PilN